MVMNMLHICGYCPLPPHEQQLGDHRYLANADNCAVKDWYITHDDILGKEGDPPI